MNNRDFESARAKEALLKDKEVETEDLVIRNPDGNVWYNDRYALKQRSMKDKEDKCCGVCCWFYAEDTYGFGCCPFHFGEVRECGNECDVPLEFVSRKQMRHYMAVLLQANRYRRDPNVPAIHKMPRPTELGKAIDFAVKYMKIFSEL